MADPILKPVSALAPAATLTGAELVPVVQGGAMVRATAQEIADLAGAAQSSGGAAVRPLPLLADMWWLPQLVNGQNLTTVVPPQFSTEYTPIVIDRQITVTTLGVEVVAAQAGSSNISIYAPLTSGLPGALLASTGPIDSSSTGLKTATISVTLGSGLYWLAFFGNLSTFRAASDTSLAAIGRTGLITAPVTMLLGGGGPIDPAHTSLSPNWGPAVLIHARYQ